MNKPSRLSVLTSVVAAGIVILIAGAAAIYEGDVKWLEPVTDAVYKTTPRK